MKYLIILTTLLLSLNIEAKQKLYKWTDDEGNVHYSEKKPQNQELEPVKIYKSKATTIENQQTKNPDENTSNELTPEQIAVMEFNKAEKKRVQAIQDRENCKIAQQNKITLEKSMSVKKKNPATGEYIVMDKTEVNKKLQEVKKAIKRLCQ
jgi:hypothetical protein